ncbi:MAG: Spy/CpxP family protein refolding chaperone [Chthoniobacterales bacterium]
MKLTLITLSAVSALALGSSAFANDQETGGQDQGGGHGRHHSALERVTEQLNLTPEQKAKVQPIVDQATPQIESIRRDAMEKTKAVMDNAMSQIRPMLTPEQQKKLDEAKTERHGGREGHGGRHNHRGQGGQGAQDDSDNG